MKTKLTNLELGRPEELRECAHPGCERRGFQRFCKEHAPESGVKKIDRMNVVPRLSPAEREEV